MKGEIFIEGKIFKTRGHFHKKREMEIEIMREREREREIQKP